MFQCFHERWKYFSFAHFCMQYKRSFLEKYFQNHSSFTKQTEPQSKYIFPACELWKNCWRAKFQNLDGDEKKISLLKGKYRKTLSACVFSLFLIFGLTFGIIFEFVEVCSILERENDIMIMNFSSMCNAVHEL